MRAGTRARRSCCFSEILSWPQVWSWGDAGEGKAGPWPLAFWRERQGHSASAEGASIHKVPRRCGVVQKAAQAGCGVHLLAADAVVHPPPAVFCSSLPAESLPLFKAASAAFPITW